MTKPPNDPVEIKPFDQLSLRELHDLLALRTLVFVVGQKITSEPEIDGYDPECAHALLWTSASPNGARRLIGTARLFIDRDPITIGRVAIHPDFQGSGLGSLMMQAIQAHLGTRRAMLHAQAHLQTWYQRLGWHPEGDLFMEADIPHITMRFDAASRDS